ncbi:DUF4238 domain-containing protein [Rhizobium aegyptiacum]|uniref:DUF4238 domain-containing protein n=1 Tax=Rhizobium aegyptiacum TaxID=1764550 RepID=UPI000A4ACADC
MKHHYIPKFYLLPWVSDEDGKLTEFRRLTNPHTQVQYIEDKRRGRNETGFEENLYTLPGTTKETKDNVKRYSWAPSMRRPPLPGASCFTA